MGTLKQITIPAARCVTLEEAKSHLRVDTDHEDSLIASYLDAAIAECASFAGRAFNQAGYRATLDCWPHCRFVDVPTAPVVSVISVAYLDESGNQQTVDAENWYWHATPEGARVWFKSAYDFPSLVDEPGRERVTVDLEAGYDPPDYSEGEDPELKLPPQARAAILLTVGHLFANRESVVVGKLAVELPRGASHLLSQIRIYR